MKKQTQIFITWKTIQDVCCCKARIHSSLFQKSLFQISHIAPPTPKLSLHISWSFKKCFLAHQLILGAHPHKMRHYYPPVLPIRKLKHRADDWLVWPEIGVSMGFLVLIQDWTTFRSPRSKQVNLDPSGSGSIQAKSPQKVRVQDGWTGRAGPTQLKGGSTLEKGDPELRWLCEYVAWASAWGTPHLSLVAQSLLATGLRGLCRGQSSELRAELLRATNIFPAQPSPEPSLGNVHLRQCAPEAAQWAGVCKGLIPPPFSEALASLWQHFYLWHRPSKLGKSISPISHSRKNQV